MSDRERIEAELNEMMAGAGGMLSVRTVYGLVSQWLNERERVAISLAVDYLSDIDRIATHIASHSELWLVHNRFDMAAFGQHFKTDGIAGAIGKTIIRLEYAYGSGFRPSGAIQYCLDVARDARMLQTELSK